VLDMLILNLSLQVISTLIWTMMMIVSLNLSVILCAPFTSVVAMTYFQARKFQHMSTWPCNMKAKLTLSYLPILAM